VDRRLKVLPVKSHEITHKSHQSIEATASLAQSRSQIATHLADAGEGLAQR
jgi:hypothetical protein